MECPKCHDNDLILIDYVLSETGDYAVTFECRQCGDQFTTYLSERQLAEYK
jgi:transcriptional regulator NrdR family protein